MNLDQSNTPFVTYFSGDPKNMSMLIMEIIDVKECPWPEPTGKVIPSHFGVCAHGHISDVHGSFCSS